MKELGELEANFQELAKRKARVVVVSMDDRENAQASQAEFPRLLVVADSDRTMSQSLAVIHPGAASGGADTDAPTTILVDGTGTVRWLFRPDRFLERLSARQLASAFDQWMPGT